MSGFIAIVDADGTPGDERALPDMLAALSSRGERTQTSRHAGVTLAVTRFDWELAGFAGPSLLVHDDEITVAADASLYHRDDLERRLRAAGVRPSGVTAAHLIAAAYRAWGTDCSRHLEGDFAFVAYDGRRRRTFAARDFMGRRPLYYAQIGRTLVVASTVRAIVAHPACSRDLDEVALGELVGVTLFGHDRTPYLAVKALPAATWLLHEESGPVRTGEYWRLQVDSSAEGESFDAAIERLRELLEAAILQRCSTVGSTAIWLSGGYDSPVMYGVGNAALDRHHLERLVPVSFSYPEGDPGREDELISDIARFWSAQPTWLSIGDVPLLEDAEAHAARADIPFQHAFENWLRALLGATHRQGARVALYGDGGDQLFAVSTVFLRDLFSGLHWRELRREWRSFGGGGARALWRSIVSPVLAEEARVLGRRHQPQITLPSWLLRDFVARHQLEDLQAQAEASLTHGGGGRAAAETRRSLTNPTIQRVLAGFSSLALEHSVELRAPLLDQRIVDFALARPRSERASDGAVKHLLRRTAQDLLPAHVLAPRKQKTGVLTDYFARSFRADPRRVVSDAFAQPMLAELGIIDAALLQQAWRDYQAGAGGGGHLFVAFQTELWLRARNGAPVRASEPPLRIRVPAAGFVQ